MEMALTEEQQMIQDTARQFADSVLAPAAASLDEHAGRDIRSIHLSGLKTAWLGYLDIGEFLKNLQTIGKQTA